MWARGGVPAAARLWPAAGAALALLVQAGPALGDAPVHRGAVPPPALPGSRALQSLARERFALVQVDRSGAWMAAPLLRRAGARLVSKRLGIWRAPGGSVVRVVRALERAGLVEAAETDRPLAGTGRSAGGDALRPSEWWRAAVGGDQAAPPGPGKPVTVIDSGVDLAHPEFAARPDTIPLNPQFVSPGDEEHGTMVSSVIGAPDNGIGLVGIYPRAVLQLWDATGQSGELTTSSVIEGLEAAAAHGPGVVNMSFGGFEDDPLLREAIDMAVGSGLVLVAAAGNDRGSGSRDAYPGSLPHVLTVGATDERGALAAFSSASPGLDLVAPGEDIPVAVPTASSPSGFATASGTSFSAPLVAGAAAWVWTMRPHLDGTELAELMRLSARDLGAHGYDAETGYGLLDLPRALTAPAPAPDPGEPNDDVFLVKPKGLFAVGAAPLKRPAIRASLDFGEDPEDVYPVVVAAGGAVTITLRPEANADLEVWRAGTRTVAELGAARARDLLGASARLGRRTDAVTVANRTRHSQTVYVDVFLGPDVPAAGYALTLRTRLHP